MLSATAVLLAAIAGGFASTYVYDSSAPLRIRVASGTVIGFAVMSLAGFVAAMALGLHVPAVVLAIVVTLSPIAVFLAGATRRQLRTEVEGAVAWLRSSARQPRAIALFLAALGAAGVVWSLMSRAMMVRAGGAIYTGTNHNYGDLPMHLTVVARLVAGNNLPPEHPAYAGVHFTYPFLTDVLSALLVVAGADLRTAIVLPAILGALALIFLLHQWTLELTGDALAAWLAPVLVLVGGGLGWWGFVQEAWQAPGNVWGLLSRLPHDYTMQATGLRFGNVVTTLLIPQRGINLALPLAVVVFRQWWLAVRDGAPASNGSARRLLAAGIVAGLLPLVHGHSYAVVVGMACCLAILFPMWRAWTWFLVAAIGLGAPQLLWLAKGSAINSASFIGFSFGWDRGETGAVPFWLINTGALIPILVWALATDAGRKVVPPALRRFYLPFLLCFAVPNVVRLAPWIWDNIKILVYWFLASAPVVSLVLARWYRAGRWYRAAAVALTLSLTAAGTLDLWRVMSGSAALSVLDEKAVAFAALTAAATDSNATILHAPIHNHSVALSGRRSVMGYPGHLWSQGLDYTARERDIRAIYAGGLGADGLLAQYQIDYVVVGAEERQFTTVSDAYFARYPVVAAFDTYRLHRVGSSSQ